MNYLAHQHVAHDTLESRIGNALADHVKGKAFEALPLLIQHGVRQHRAVDAFTDSHQFVQRSITRISTKWGWFSGIIIDVYYDHLLSRNWSQYSSEPLRSFADRMYDMFDTCLPYLDSEDHEFYLRFRRLDSFILYGSLEGITGTLSRISRYIEKRMPKRAVKLEESIPDLVEHAKGIEEDFHTFYPQLQAFAKAWKLV
jgi:acyl carrier protein phosphodiesterase